MTAPFLVGIAGGSCSGKSTFARQLAALLQDVAVASISFDSYYRPLTHLSPAERAAVNFDHPDSLDGELFLQHLRSLRRGRPIEQPRYDFATHDRLPEPRHVAPAPLVLVDGILLLALPEVPALLDHAVYLEAPEHVRLTRRVARDTVERGRSEASVRAQFAATVAPMHDAFVRPSAAHATERLPWGTDLDAAAIALADRLRSR